MRRHKLLIALGIFVALLAGIALYINNFDWNRAKPWLAKKGIVIDGELEVHLGVHPVVVAHQIKIDPVFAADRVEVHGELWPLLKKRLEIPVLRVNDGWYRLDRELPTFGAEPKTPEDQAEKSKLPSFELVPGDWSVTNFTVKDDSLTSKIANLTAQHHNGKDVTLTADGNVNGLRAELRAELRNYLKAVLKNERVDLDATASIGEATLAARGQIANVAELTGLDIRINAEGKGLTKIFAAFGIRLSDELAPFRIATHLKRDAQTWLFDDIDAAVGPSQVKGHVRIDPSKKPVAIAVTAQMPHLAFADFGPFMPKSVAEELPPAKLAGAKGPAGAKGVTGARGGTGVAPTKAPLFSDAALPTDGLDALDLFVDVKVAKFVGPDKASLIQAFNVKVTARDRTLTVEPLWMKLAGGEMETTLHYDATKKTPHARLRSTMKQVNLGPIAAEFLKDGGLSSKKLGKLEIDELLTGKLGARLDVTGNGHSFARMMGGLDGSVKLALEDGKMSSLIVEILGMDVTESIGTLLAENQTIAMDCLLIDLAAKEGAVQPNVVLVSTKDSDIMLKGTLDLRQESLEAVLKTEPKDFSLGALRTPITIQGPLSNLKVDVDREQAFGRLAATIALGALVTPAAALIPLIETGLGKEGRCSEYGRQIVALTKLQPKNPQVTH